MRGAKAINRTVFPLVGACLLVFLPAEALADTIHEPTVGVAGGGRSTPIYSTSFSFTLTSCAVSPTPEGCTFWGEEGPQAAFEGENDSGVDWSVLTLALDFPALPYSVSLTCDGGTLFTLNNCPETLPTGATSVTFTFFRGTGTGISTASDDYDPSTFAIGVGFYNDLWPSTSIPTGGTGQVPEPSTLVLSVMGLVATAAVRPTRRAMRKRRA